ncbi:hybrid non-ribosomal peptide synthetase/type I polyketide synthase [Brevibacillus parabrevis]|uniref:hybrid non-ribosomal peptide synthetase/type I polyketide synthase n=1 Tax=Brevibacillus parabrevis TaxID=54914 RepID=UPI001F612B2F|nr:hybrid non-ribosomal peptide synthetase/type I polyketide synthase [Brevibacillus parabrevis]MDR5002044.1 amino acid adenylation domain-containing protein [Brevibacillus parabrevis]
MGHEYNGLEIAVIGLAGRFPGASNVTAYWENLKNGVHSIQTFSEAELIEAGVDPQAVKSAEYVKAKGYLESGNRFDARFFDYTPLEAELMDPQMKVFHECIWEALEDAGYAAQVEQKLIGLFAGASPNHMWEALMSLSGKSEAIGHWAATQLVDKDYLSLRIAHKLNLKGPALTIYTACSTSLVAVHMAAQSLLNGECDLALAGGVTVTLPGKSGYVYQEGMILSPDGKCKAFDANGQGIVGGDGAGVVVLKRLQDAIDDRDQIHAVIKGSAVNNDGMQKTGFTAPSTIGQAEVIRTALKVAEVAPESVAYIECHGTGTPLGDPIELEALELAYQPSQKHSCALGSVKTNIGHLDSAAGIASFIKAVLAIKHRQLPPSLHFQSPNPHLDVIEKGFYINDKLTEWEKTDEPLRAGISAFGIGGTNAHVIIEEAPAVREASAGRSWQLMLLSAKTEQALERYKQNVEEYLHANPDARLEDVAYSLQVGRKHFPVREIALCNQTLAQPLRFIGQDSKAAFAKEKLSVAFVFPDFAADSWEEGELAEIVHLCQEEPAVQQVMAQALRLLNQQVFGQAAVSIAEKLRAPKHGQALRFALYYAIAKLFKDWGVEPQSMWGYGKGNLLVECLEGRLAFGDAIHALVGRDRLDHFAQTESNRPVSKPDGLCLIFGSAQAGEPGMEQVAAYGHQLRLERIHSYAILEALGTMWLYGQEINWTAYYQHEERNRVSLPTYAFDSQEFPVDKSLFNFGQFASRLQPSESSAAHRREDIRSWFYVPAWESSALPAYAEKAIASEATWLIFQDQTGLGEALASELKERGATYIIVEQAERYQRVTSAHYRLNPQKPEELDSLLDDLQTVPDCISYLWTVTSPIEPELAAVEPSQQQFFYSLLQLARYIGSKAGSKKMRLQIVTNGLYSVTQDEPICPLKGVVLGASKIIPYEYPNSKVCTVDIELPAGDKQTGNHMALAANLLREFQFDFPHKQVALRGKSRWIEAVREPVLVKQPEKLPLLKEKLVCLITGGLGGMGFALAEYLAKSYQARLVLIGRSAFPPREQWTQWIEDKPDHHLSGKIRTILSLEQAGAMIDVYSVDISDYSAMQKVVREAEMRFGPITGVLHTAGVPDYVGVIQRRTKEMTDPILLPKVQGTIVLDTLFAERALDFFILFSSIGNYIYGRKFGQVGYNAANEFLDAFAAYRLQKRAGYTASINWNDWAEVGMSVTAMEKNRSMNRQVNERQFAEEAISPQQGVEVLRYLLENQFHRAIVSVLELPALMEESNQLSEEFILEKEAAVAVQTELVPAKINRATLSEAELTEIIADVWRSVLGIAAIRSDEDFFALGGDSLKAITMIALLYKKLDVKLPLPTFFNKPTIGEIACFIRGADRTDFSQIPKAQEKAGYPLTSGQKRLYFLSQMEEANKQYNNIIALRVKGSLSYEKLERCLNELIRRHESLRTSFQRIDGELLQVIHEPFPFPADYRELNEPISDAHIEAWIQPFDLGVAPVWKVGIFKESEQSHVLVFNIHHIITDGTSNSILIDEFTALYQQQDGQSSGLPALSVQYKDYAEWQQEKTTLAGHQADQEYWTGMFSGEIPLLDLPTDFSRPPYKTYRGGMEMFSIPQRQADEIKRMATSHEATLYMVLLAAWNVLLAKLGNQDEIIVGIPTSGRNHSDIQNVIGMFVQTLPLKSTVRSDMTFAELLNAIKGNMSHALEHQDYPFEELVSQIELSRDFGRNPLFDVMFAFQNVSRQGSGENHSSAGLQIEPYSFKTNTARFDLTLDGEEREGELFFTVEYASDLFTKETITRFIRYFQKLLQDVIAQPQQKMSQLSLLDADERERLVSGFNQTAGEYPEQLLVHELFEAMAEKCADQPALTFHNQTMTYRELDARANQLAHALKSHGVGAGQVVALIATRSCDMIAGLLAIGKAGGAYLPVDPSLPANRVAYMLADSRVRVILTNTTVEAAGERQVIDMRDPYVAAQPQERLPLENSSTDVAYCMYTSGTTGFPKGILIEHRALINFLHGMTDVLSFGENEKFLSLTTVSFDIFWLESILPLLTGHQVVIADEDCQRDVLKLASLVRREKITVMQTTPSRLKLLLAEPELAGQLSRLRYLLIGGEALPQPLADAAVRLLPEGRVYNLYGPTETTIWSTIQEVAATQPVTIGRPLKNTQVYVLSPELMPQPVGVPGLLYIGGHGLARGYQNNPELTREKFIDNPFRPGEKMYATGDMARWTREGLLDYLGRTDFQVKIRGYRIEQSEIENLLDAHPAVEKAVVHVQQDAQHEQLLVAYYTAAYPVTSQELRDYLRQQLPEYMIPSLFMPLAQIPLTINGKIDRKSLPEVTGVAAEQQELVEPRDEVEAKLYDIWRNVLRSESMSVRDRFFELGGNSIQIMQLVYEINNSFACSMQFKDFIELQTIEAIAGFIREAIHEERVADLPALIPEPSQLHEPFPLTNVQMAYYLGRSSSFELGGVSTHSYQEIVTRLDILRLNHCLNLLIRRHPALRTIFLPDARQQILADIPEYAIDIRDLQGCDKEEKAAILAKERERMSHAIFRPGQWPLFEIKAFRLNGQESLLCISFDLLIMDAYSLEILGKELQKLYEGAADELDELSLSFRDYMIGYERLKTSSLYLQDKEYWMAKLDDFPLAPEIPLQVQPSHVKNPYFQRKSKRYAKESWQVLKKAAQKHNLTPSAVLCTAYAEVLANWSNQLDFSLNLTLFNRLPLHPDVDKLVGDFTSVALVEVRLHPADTFWEKAGKVQQSLMEALAHRHFDGIDVMREISKQRELGNKAVLPIVFTSALFENEDSVQQATDDAEYTSEWENDTSGITQTSQVYLDNQVALLDGNIVINWDYISELFDPVVIDTMFAQYLTRIDTILNDEAEKELPSVSVSDRAAIDAYNDTAVDIASKTLHGLFEETVAQTPFAVAIEDGETQITYEALNERANKVASCLRHIGVAPGDLIGVIAKREIATFAYLLGILKSGAAYVPIDPDYPADRVDYIRRHSQCKLVLESDFYERNELEHAAQKYEAAAVQPEQLAYVIYTSGSTGNPKGVMIRHVAACNTIQDINQKFHVAAHDRILGVSSLCFDLSVYDIFGAFAAGATLVLVKDQKDMAQLADTITAKNITIWNSVPAIMDRVAAEKKERGEQRDEQLRLVMLSGDWIPLTLPQAIRESFPGAEVISLGGATEASIWSIYYPIDEVGPEWKSIFYGKPLANQQFYVLNSRMELCPLSVPGELYIGGRGVADGYLHDAEKTNRSFVHHPQFGYIYRTGDYGVLHRNGLIEFLGRKDQQVKIGGYRIELGEVESRLLQIDTVRNAVVLVAGEADKRLYAYLVPETEPHDRDAFINEIRSRLAKALPDYMIPYHFIVVEQLPLTANGKVDVQALLKLKPTGTSTGTAYVAPRNEVEASIVAVFQEVLETDRVGVLDNFFEMGIHSLQIGMINSKLKDVFAREIPILAMFEHANIHALAAYLTAENDDQPDEGQEETINVRNQGRERIKQRNAKRRRNSESE